MSSKPASPQRTPYVNHLPRATNVLIVTMAAVITVFGMRKLDWLLGPFLLAVMIVILINPIFQLMVKRGVPRIAALGVLILAIYGLLIGLTSIIALSIARLATLLPNYVTQLTSSLQFFSDQLARLEIGSAQIRELLGSVDLASVARFLTNHIPSLFGAGANVLFLASLLMFLGIESTQVGRRTVYLLQDHPRLANGLQDFVRNTRRFLAATGVFAAIVGVLDTIFLLMIDIPLAPLWGLLAAACNFIPYVGFIIGLVPPALLALLNGDWQLMIVIIVVYVVLNSIVTTIIPAKVVGDLVGMSMTLTMMSVAFWSWIFGPIGAVLAVPLSLMAKAILVDSDPTARWLSGFLNSDDRNRRLQGEDPEAP